MTLPARPGRAAGGRRVRSGWARRFGFAVLDVFTTRQLSGAGVLQGAWRGVGRWRGGAVTSGCAAGMARQSLLMQDIGKELATAY